MRFQGLDLNLLVLFDALMRTRSVTRSAETLHLSQPGISSALKRLREHFNDELFVTHGRSMYPTACAEALRPNVALCLHAAEQLMRTSNAFDPATSQRTFRICASDYMATAVLGALSRALSSEAPHVHLDLILNDDHSSGQLRSGMIDLLIVPQDYMARDLPCDPLLDERHVVIGWAKNSLLACGRTISETEFLSAGHARVAVGYDRTGVFSDRHLELLGKTRRFEVTGSTFGLLPWLLIGTQRLAVVQERLALTMASVHDLAITQIPFDFPVMHEIMQYHPIKANDPGLIWLRERLRAEISAVNAYAGYFQANAPVIK